MVNAGRPRVSETELRQVAPHRIAVKDSFLAAAVLIAPCSWALHLALSYGLIYPAVDWQSKAALHLVGAASALLCMLSIALGVQGLRRAHLGTALDASERERMRFLATCACLSGALFLLATAALAVPVVMLSLRGRP
jgi:hypothetical protein